MREAVRAHITVSISGLSIEQAGHLTSALATLTGMLGVPEPVRETAAEVAAQLDATLREIGA
jgi:hypothetical protein